MRDVQVGDSEDVCPILVVELELKDGYYDAVVGDYTATPCNSFLFFFCFCLGPLSCHILSVGPLAFGGFTVTTSF